MSDMSVDSDTVIIPTWTLQDRLRKAREAAGLRQEDMAERLAKGRATISGWESGAHRPDELALRAWAAETHVPVDWLRTGAPVTECYRGPPAHRPDSRRAA